MKKVSKNEKGITLIVLVITIIIFLILAGITIGTIGGENGIIEKTKRAKTIQIISEMKERLILAIHNLQVEKLGEATLEDINQEWIDKEIEEYTCTVSETTPENEKEIIMEKDKTKGKFIIDGNLNIIEKEYSDINLTYQVIEREKGKAKIIIKITEKINGIKEVEFPEGNIIKCNGKKEVAIDYEVKIGEEYKIKITSKNEDEKEGIIKIEDETWDGWIKLTLYYPPKSINKMWRLGEKGEIRSNLKLEWKEYTGPITIPMSRTKDVWIKYEIDNKQIIKSPEEKVLVEIENEGIENNKQKIEIIYDEESIVKEYNIDGTGWKTYTGEFVIEKSSLIMARAKKEEEVKDNSGNVIAKRDKWGEDNKYITIVTEKDIEDLINKEIITNQEKEEAENKVTIDKIEKEHPNIKEEIKEIKDKNPEKTDKEIIEEIKEKYPEIEIPKVTPEEIIKELIKEEQIKPEEVGKIPEEAKEIVDKNNVLQGPEIIVTPENEKVEEVKVKIETKEKAREIYIKIGEEEYVKYEKEITINKNKIISAYYINEEGKESKITYKQISNIKKGGLPYLKIKADPYPYPNDTGRKSVKITLEYEGANNVEYSEDGVRYRSYLGEFSITKNKRIYARASNSNGTTKVYLDITNIGKITEAPEKNDNIVNKVNDIENGNTSGGGNTSGEGENNTETNRPIIDETDKYTIINKNEYYLIKLKYPSEATLQEYKVQEQEWKRYNEQGILFVKPEYKDDVLDENGKLKGKIQNEKGQIIDFYGDIQILDIQYEKIYENISIRWNAYPGQAPTIIPNTTELSKNVTIGILYDNSLVKKQYKIKYSDKTETEWKEYKEPILIEQNETIIYARGLDTSEVWTNEASYYINNIDNEPPEIKISGEFEKTIRNLQIAIKVKDKNKIEIIKYSEGKKDKEYFKENGEVIKNYSRKIINENGIYTIYAKDIVGNETIYELNITNIDITAVPNPIITLDKEPYIIDGIEWYPYGTTMTITYLENMTDLTGYYRNKYGEKEDISYNWNGWNSNDTNHIYTGKLTETETWQAKIVDATGEESEIVEEEIHIMASENTLQSNYQKIGNIYPVLITSYSNISIYGTDIYCCTLYKSSYIKTAAKHMGLIKEEEIKENPRLLKIKIVECPEEGYVGSIRNGVKSSNVSYSESYLGFVFIGENGQEIKGPTIESISQVPAENEITVGVEAKAYNGAEIETYYYKMDNGEYIESESSTYKFKEVKPYVNHTIEVYVKDTKGCISAVQKITQRTANELPTPTIALDKEPYIIDGIKWYPYGTTMTITYLENMTDLTGYYRNKYGEKEDISYNWSDWNSNGISQICKRRLTETETWQVKIVDATGEDGQIVEEEIHIMASENTLQSNYQKVGNIYPVLITSYLNSLTYGTDIYCCAGYTSYIKTAAKHMGLIKEGEIKENPRLLKIKIVECPEGGYVGSTRNGVKSSDAPYNESCLGFVFIGEDGHEIKGMER